MARVIGAENDPKALQSAKDCISEAVDEWNTRHNWRFLQIVAPDIAVVAGTSSYALPSTFKKPYDAYLIIGRQKLNYVSRQEWDSYAPGDVSQGLSFAYSLFNTGTTGNIELLSIPSQPDILVVRYYRPIIAPTNDDEPLDIPKRYEGALIAMARGILSSLKDADRKADLWTTRGEKGYLQAKMDDIKIPDEVLSFDPVPYFSPALNPNWTGQWMFEE